jgi:hypothetical protein
LWGEWPEAGKVPPPRYPIDDNIVTLADIDDETIFVLDGEGTLWLWLYLGKGTQPVRNPTPDPGDGDGGGGIVGGGPGGATDDGPNIDDPPVPGA